LQDAIEEKFRLLEERDTEVRQLKLSLREKEHDLERANHMLLTTEEAIDVSDDLCLSCTHSHVSFLETVAVKYGNNVCNKITCHTWFCLAPLMYLKSCNYCPLKDSWLVCSFNPS
jgi:hypothetical protein